MNKRKSEGLKYFIAGVIDSQVYTDSNAVCVKKKEKEKRGKLG